jgi:hypothetical protein
VTANFLAVWSIRYNKLFLDGMRVEFNWLRLRTVFRLNFRWFKSDVFGWSCTFVGVFHILPTWVFAWLMRFFSTDGYNCWLFFLWSTVEIIFGYLRVLLAFKLILRHPDLLKQLLSTTWRLNLCYNWLGNYLGLDLGIDAFNLNLVVVSRWLMS